MKAAAIVYTSETGHTADYAHLLAKKTGLPVYSLADAKKALPHDTKIVYLGWLMASRVKDLKKAANLFDIKILCAVGLAPSGFQLDEVRKANNLPAELPVFTLQGGMDRAKLRGVNAFAIKMLIRMLNTKVDKTPEDEGMLDLLNKGGYYVCEENLTPVVQCLRGE